MPEMPQPYRTTAAMDITDFPCWLVSEDPVEIAAHYRIALHVARNTARKCGYAIGAHGSMRRDLDLIAAPWVEGCVSPAVLVECLQMALVGVYVPMNLRAQPKPYDRVGGVFSIGRRAMVDISIMAGGLG